MSCEGNRQRFFQLVQNVCGLDARTLEGLYQAGRAAGVRPGEEAKLTEKARWLFNDMRLAGLTPPTHSADGLPRMEARAGYAAVFDHLRSQPAPPPPQELWSERGLVGGFFRIQPFDLLSHEGANLKGYIGHRFRPGEGKHVWFGYGLHSAQEASKVIEPGSENCTIANVLDDERPLYEAFLKGDRDGYLEDGYSLEGFDADGYDPDGYSLYGLRRADLNDDALVEQATRTRLDILVQRPHRKRPESVSVDIEGFDEDGFRPGHGDRLSDCDRFGFDRRGFRQGRSWTGYDENGLDASGRPAPARRGYDAWGYERKSGLTAPDEHGQRFNLIGWLYDPATDECFDPQNPSRRMKHGGSWGYSPVLRKVVLKRSYVPGVEEMKARLRNPALRWEEYRHGGGALLRYGHLKDIERSTRIIYNSPEMRYLRSEKRSTLNPKASLLGAALRCPKCARFTGARPHLCPAIHNRKIMPLANGVVLEYVSGMYLPLGTGIPVKDVVEEILDMFRQRLEYRLFGSDIPLKRAGNLYNDSGLPSEFKSYLPYLATGDLMAMQGYRQDDERAIVIETPFTPHFDPEYEGGPLPGFHWKSGISQDGYDPWGFHYLTRRTEEGFSQRGVRSLIGLSRTLREAEEKLRRLGKDAKRMLEVTYSQIASSIAGEVRHVHIEESGGPRPDMFWTDMRGQIRAERYPLRHTEHNSAVNNLLAMKAGIYHELGHEEDTPRQLFARVVEIARGMERVEGIPPEQAGLVAEVYNILEDGRMERQQARRRRGAAAILAAEALINPRWDERVGDDIPLGLQVMGMMLYRALPFFSVRQAVLEAAPQRVQRLYREIEPLVDRAMRSPEEAFQASIEITRRLLASGPDMQDLARQMTGQKSFGGKWLQAGQDQGQPLILSALPDVGGEMPDRTVSIPSPGWGAAEEPEGLGRPPAQGAEKPHGTERAEKQAARGDAGGEYTPEVDEDFFRRLGSKVDFDAIFSELAADVRYGANTILHSPLGRELQKPLENIEVIEIEVPHHKLRHFVRPLRVKKGGAEEDYRALRAEAQAEGRRVARRLETLREEIHRKTRLQTSGALDRKRFKRAVAGADAVYRQPRLQDVTSLAVSIQLDMSASMGEQVHTGRLAATTLALESALQRLGAGYMVSAFGDGTALIKTFGDERIGDEQIRAMLKTNLGGTTGSPAMHLSLLGLKATRAANKLHFLLTDGLLSDEQAVAQEAEEMRRNGILPFGIFLGRERQDSQASFDKIFGAGNWETIQNLSDLSDVAARRIEQIYRKILATR